MESMVVTEEQPPTLPQEIAAPTAAPTAAPELAAPLVAQPEAPPGAPLAAPLEIPLAAPLAVLLAPPQEAANSLLSLENRGTKRKDGDELEGLEPKKIASKMPKRCTVIG